MCTFTSSWSWLEYRVFRVILTRQTGRQTCRRNGWSPLDLRSAQKYLLATTLTGCKNTHGRWKLWNPTKQLCSSSCWQWSGVLVRNEQRMYHAKYFLRWKVDSASSGELVPASLVTLFISCHFKSIDPQFLLGNHIYQLPHQVYSSCNPAIMFLAVPRLASTITSQSPRMVSKQSWHSLLKIQGGLSKLKLPENPCKKEHSTMWQLLFWGWGYFRDGQ